MSDHQTERTIELVSGYVSQKREDKAIITIVIIEITGTKLVERASNTAQAYFELSSNFLRN